MDVDWAARARKVAGCNRRAIHSASENVSGFQPSANHVAWKAAALGFQQHVLPLVDHMFKHLRGGKVTKVWVTTVSHEGVVRISDERHLGY